MTGDDQAVAEQLMMAFAEQTGLLPAAKFPRRYLWTDAFAVCNFLELSRLSGDPRFTSLAVQLVGQVHDQLGQHRQDDPRSGWLSGLDEEEGRAHPTAGGLRIGKRLMEREAEELLDDQLEWDRDGQYFHYLTKWMHSLNRVYQVTGERAYWQWAVELAKVAHGKFIYALPSGEKRIHWKMSIDLSRPLVPGMGQHDPLDGSLTCLELQASGAPVECGLLDIEIDVLTAICRGKSWMTDDPLGIGGLLSDSYKLTQLMVSGFLLQEKLLKEMLTAALLGLETCVAGKPFSLGADSRLAFRELGLAIGIHAVERLALLVANHPGCFQDRAALVDLTKRLLPYRTLADGITHFWLADSNRQGPGWLDHHDINVAMLATSLVPDGFLALGAGR